MKSILKPLPLSGGLYPVRRLKQVLAYEVEMLQEMHNALLSKLESLGIDEVSGYVLNEMTYPLRQEGKTNQWRKPEEFAELWLQLLRRSTKL